MKMRMTVAAIRAAIVVMNTRHARSDRKRSANRFPAAAQKRQTKRLMPTKVIASRNASADGGRPMPKAAEAAMVTAQILGLTA